jgi:short subunit dehydrogenase-like uncharacterized protein
MEESPEYIAVYGATGYTGTRICEQLARRGVDFVAAGRNIDKLQTLSSKLGAEHGVVPTLRQAEVDDERTLDTLLQHVDILINAAGPFAEVGRPVVRAALRNDVHYLDTSGEQAHLNWVKSSCADVSDRVIMPSCAFEYATGNIAADAAARDGHRSLGIAYHSPGMTTSPGTKRSIIRSIGEPGLTYRDGRHESRSVAYRRYRLALPDGRDAQAVWIPGGEPLTVPSFADVDTVETAVVLPSAAANLLHRTSPVVPSVMRGLAPLLDGAVEWFGSDDTEWDDTENAFQVVAFEPDSGECIAAVSGTGPYSATARIIVETAQRLLEHPPEQGGFCQIPDLFDGAEFASSVGLDVLHP